MVSGFENFRVSAPGTVRHYTSLANRDNLVVKSLVRSDVPIALTINLKKAHVVSIDLSSWNSLASNSTLEKILGFLFNISYLDPAV